MLTTMYRNTRTPDRASHIRDQRTIQPLAQPIPLPKTAAHMREKFSPRQRAMWFCKADCKVPGPELPALTVENAWRRSEPRRAARVCKARGWMLESSKQILDSRGLYGGPVLGIGLGAGLRYSFPWHITAKYKHGRARSIRGTASSTRGSSGDTLILTLVRYRRLMPNVKLASYNRPVFAESASAVALRGPSADPASDKTTHLCG
ncbi:hypothetical protein EJ06DRAFT_173690 [Trichodelitschia bisporula]|uniref:Uncharacterized protein n=1 Tax=Trichodelitschia bisporula TaxID=703511 RepID=A0A6G1HLR1_9PEZI|nr:hypothetical protein EJ06DRAFT_173690 [Trichodelitschia bisporula]